MATVKSAHPAGAALHHRGSPPPSSEVHREHARHAAPHHPHARPARLPRLWHFAAEYLLLLPLGAALALVWANVAPESYFRMAFGAGFAVTDVAMVLFFGLIMKEVAEATAPGGVLHPWQRVALPLVSAAGVTVLPALAFVAAVPIFDEPRLADGWPVIFAIDIAFGYFIARMIFGRHPVIPFFLLLAICANALGILALAVASGADLRPGSFLLLMAAALATAWALRRNRVKSFWPYIAGAGALSWAALYFGGFEPALALVPIVPFLPHARRDPGFFVDASPSSHDTLSRFELWCRHPAQVALFFFGLVSAGVPLKALYWGALNLSGAAAVAKPLGLLFGVWVALSLGMHLPQRVGWREVTVVGFIATIGFTVALFFANAALGPGPTLSAIRINAVVSLFGSALAFGAAFLLRAGRFAHR
jgi:NhaA family Na+:H+ antiporter